MVKNPLKVIYAIISIPLGLIGLISLSQNVILWKQFFADFAIIYDTVVYPVFKVIPFDIHDRLKDYFFIGVLCGISFIIALDYGIKNDLLNSYGNNKAVKVFYFIIYLFFWPIGLVISITQAIGFLDCDNKERNIKVMFVYWLLSFLLIFIILIVVNYQL